VYATGPDAVLSVPLEGVEAKLRILNMPISMAKQKSAQATAARKRKRAERELVVFCIGVVGLHDGQNDTLIRPRCQNWMRFGTKCVKKVRLLELLTKFLGLGLVNFRL
jgi:hypothetical protein